MVAHELRAHSEYFLGGLSECFCALRAGRVVFVVGFVYGFVDVNKIKINRGETK